MNRQRGRLISPGKWFSLPWYFLAFSAYPVLALMAVNKGQVKAGAVWRPLLVSILFAVLLCALIKLVLRDRYRAAFLAALWLALFFSYGHIHIMLTEKWDKIHVTSRLLTREKRMWILNAYPLPGQTDKLYPGISLVNAFRLISDSYFGGQYGLLEDVWYFSSVPNLYEFSAVPDRCKSPEASSS
jgi:hypothetical protein